MSIASRFLSPEYIAKVKAKILEKIDVTPSGCWLWKGKKESKKRKYPDRKQYGTLQFAGKARLAHRVSKALFHEKHILFDDRSILCCHKCDDPLCINPDHIFLGTHSDNNKDKSEKGRAQKRVLVCPHCKKDY